MRRIRITAQQRQRARLAWHDMAFDFREKAMVEAIARIIADAEERGRLDVAAAPLMPEAEP